MSAEQPEFNVPWKHNYIGSLPDFTAARPQLGRSKLSRLQDSSLHTDMRRAKNAFVDLPDNIDQAQLRVLQNNLEVSIMADLLRGSGFSVPFAAVPYTGDHIKTQQGLGISTEPIMLADRPGTTQGFVFGTSMIFNARNDSKVINRVAEGDKDIPAETSSEVLAGLEAVKNNFVLDLGILSQGVPTGFIRLATRLNLLMKEGKIGEQEMLDRLNHNFGLAAIKKMGSEANSEIKVGVSLRIMDHIFDRSKQADFELWICDDVIVAGTTLKVMAEYMRDQALARGMPLSELDGFMQKIKFYTDTGYPRKFEIDAEGHYNWTLWDTRPDKLRDIIQIDRPREAK